MSTQDKRKRASRLKVLAEILLTIKRVEKRSKKFHAKFSQVSRFPQKKRPISLSLTMQLALWEYPIIVDWSRSKRSPNFDISSAIRKSMRTRLIIDRKTLVSLKIWLVLTLLSLCMDWDFQQPGRIIGRWFLWVSQVLQW